MDTPLQATVFQHFPFPDGVACFDSQQGRDINFFSEQSRLALGPAQPLFLGTGRFFLGRKSARVCAWSTVFISLIPIFERGYDCVDYASAPPYDVVTCRGTNFCAPSWTVRTCVFLFLFLFTIFASFLLSFFHSFFLSLLFLTPSQYVL